MVENAGAPGGGTGVNGNGEGGECIRNALLGLEDVWEVGIEKISGEIGMRPQSGGDVVWGARGLMNAL